MSPALPGVSYHRTHADPHYWRAFGRTPLAAVPRESLVPGTYWPDASTAGVLPGTQFAQVEAGSGGYITLDTANATYENVEFWGELRFRAPGITLRNCAVRGPNPDTQVSNLSGCIKAYGPGYYHFTMIDCTIDPMPWITQRGASSLSPMSTGIHGANYTIKRCEITNVQDGLNMVGHTAPDSSMTVYDMNTLIEACWIHKMYYKNDWYGPSDGRTHSDAIQFNTGKNFTIRHNTIGGPRDTAGYQLWPNGYNSGDDAANAAFMIKQELNASVEARVENVMIEHNLIMGGAAGINHFYVSSRINDWSSTTIKDNLFALRGPQDNLVAVGPGPTFATLTAGYYIMVSWGINAVYSNNRIFETGEPVPVRHNDGE